MPWQAYTEDRKSGYQAISAPTTPEGLNHLRQVLFQVIWDQMIHDDLRAEQSAQHLPDTAGKAATLQTRQAEES